MHRAESCPKNGFERARTDADSAPAVQGTAQAVAMDAAPPNFFIPAASRTTLRPHPVNPGERACHAPASAAFAFRRCRHDGAFFTAATPSSTAGVSGTAGTRSPRASAPSIHVR